MAAHSPSASSTASTQSPGASSSCSASPQVFFGRKRSQHELKILAKLQATNSSWDAAPTPVRRITKRDSREFHRRKTLLLPSTPTGQSSSSGTKQWEGGLEERADIFGESASDSDTVSACSSSESETETEDEQTSPRPFSFTFSLRHSCSPSLSPASSVASLPSSHDLVEDLRDMPEAHCDLTLDFDGFVFSDTPSKAAAVQSQLADTEPETVKAEPTAGSSLLHDEVKATQDMTRQIPVADLKLESEPEQQVQVVVDTAAVKGIAVETEDETFKVLPQPERHEESPSVSGIDSAASPPSLVEEVTAAAQGNVNIEVIDSIKTLEEAQELDERAQEFCEIEEIPTAASGSPEVASEPTVEANVMETLSSSPPTESPPQARRTPPSAAELASMVADDNVGLAELAAAVASINMSRPPASPERDDLDSPLPTFRAGPVIIPAILNRHPIRDCGRSPFRDIPSPTTQHLPDFSPIRDVVSTPQLASMDSPTPASELLSSPTVQAIASRSTPTSGMSHARTPTASQSNPPALVYPPKSKILKSSVNLLSTPMQRPKEKKTDPREQAIRGQLNAAVHGIGHRTLASSVVPMSASRPTGPAIKSTPLKAQATPLTAKTMTQRSASSSCVQATPRSMPPPVPSSLHRPTLQAPTSASRPVLAPLAHQRALQPVKTIVGGKQPARVISQLPKLASKIPTADTTAIKKPMIAPVAVPARSLVSVTGRSTLALGAPSRLVGSRQVQGGSGRVLPSPARRGQNGREPVYSTYKPSNSFVFTACSISESAHEVSQPLSRHPSPQESSSSRTDVGSSSAPSRMRASSDDASAIVPVAESSSPMKPPPAYEHEEIDSKPSAKVGLEKEKMDAASKTKQARTVRPPRAAAKVANETLALPVKPKRKPAVPVPSTVPNMSEKELATKTTLNTTRNEVYFCAINRIIVRREGERPPSPTSKIRTVAEREEADKKGGRQERAKRRRRSSEGLTSDDDDELAPRRPRDRHMRGPGEDEDFNTPARPMKRSKLSPTAVAKPPYSDLSSRTSDQPQSSKYVTWDKGLVVIRSGSGRSSASGSSANVGLRSCLSLRGKPALDQHGNLVSTGKPLAEILKRTRIDVTAVFYDGEEPVPVKSTPKKKGKK